MRIAWVLKAAGMDKEFNDLLDELDSTLAPGGQLRAEWQLLSAYRFFPYIDKMMPLLKQAAVLFDGACSQVTAAPGGRHPARAVGITPRHNGGS